MTGAIVEHYRRLVRLAVMGVGVYGILTGVMILLSDEARTQGPSLVAANAFARSMGMEAHALLGACSVLAGTLTLLPRRTLSQLGLAVSSVGALFLCGSYVISASLEPTANLYGIPGQAFIAVVIGGLYLVRRADRSLVSVR